MNLNGLMIIGQGDNNLEIRCHNCGNEDFVEDKVDNVFNIKDKLYLIKNIPAKVCVRCGEKYFEPKIQRATFNLINNNTIPKLRIETDVYDYV